ncbi:MAG: hypothetical protein HYR94_22110 [Chloroflexi bacterium]|nr:hypothetical protein [Chloroflexota bacterium]
MSVEENLLTFLTHKYQELQQQHLLRSKGYLDPTDADFCLNQWTRLLVPRSVNRKNKEQKFPEIDPKQLVSIVVIPDNWAEQSIDSNSLALRTWLESNKWVYDPALSSPFQHPQIQACSEGVILPQWFPSETDKVLERFLLIRRDGMVEFGMGQETYFLHEEDVIFKLAHVVGRLWQFLGCLNDLFADFLTNKPKNILCFLNMRGTRNALLGDLAEGWKEPHENGFDAYRPRCLDKHLQIHLTIPYEGIKNEIETLVRWFATRLDNAWGHFEPRCYVHQNVDKAQPFTRRRLG